MARPGRRFAYRLALALGRVNVDAMLGEITASQLSEWEAFHVTEPWGFEMENFRAGQVCSTVANFAGRSMKEGARPLAPNDFMPQPFQAEARKRPPRDLSAEIHASFTALVA